MKAAELRIGNLVQGQPYSHPRMGVKSDGVSMIQAMGIVATYQEEIAGKPKTFQPIPLTEEWLLKFGFKKNPIAWHKDISYFPRDEFKTICVTIHQGVLIRCGDLNQWRENDDVISLLNTDIQGPIMVHQLQNLYFALTGEELTPHNQEQQNQDNG